MSKKKRKGKNSYSKKKEADRTEFIAKKRMQEVEQNIAKNAFQEAYFIMVRVLKEKFDFDNDKIKQLQTGMSEVIDEINSNRKEELNKQQGEANENDKLLKTKMEENKNG